ERASHAEVAPRALRKLLGRLRELRSHRRELQRERAAKPMVFVTTLVLIAVVVTLNLTGIVLRNRMRRKYAGSTV
ncbi:MAG: hypothetical protein CV090_05230, partial [Nitrospira sp. WS238]|nr:hypothetical protein [Nitrospira sp. WS238]